jgi:hypothetical protein
MLASIIYNYGKFFGDFKSTLKLGAYDDFKSTLKLGAYFLTLKNDSKKSL